MYLKYFWYVIKHKFFVGIFCFKMGLYKQGLWHDMHKFRKFPFITYAKHFYGGKQIKGNSKTGYSKPTTDLDDPDFDKAWLFHQKTQLHHWQFWVLMEENGNVKILPMDECYWKEMIADWYGASISTGKSNFSNYKENTKLWYLDHMDNIKLNGFTKTLVEIELGVK